MASGAPPCSWNSDREEITRPSVSAPSRAGATSGCKASNSKLTCLCSPTNHPGSFRCGRHRTPRTRPSIARVRASQQQAAAPVIKSGGRNGTTSKEKGRLVLRAHLQRLMVSPPPSSGGRCREFKPRLSRLGRLAAANP